MRRSRWLSTLVMVFLVGFGLLGSRPGRVAASGLGGVTYYVALGGTGDCTTGRNSATPLGSISGALTCAGSDNTTSFHPDRIFLAAGTYNEMLNVAVNVNIVGIGSPVLNGHWTEPLPEEGPSLITIAQGMKVGITGLTVSGQSAGRGIENDGTLTLVSTTVADGDPPINDPNNAVQTGNGGGIYNTGTLWGINDTITNNHAWYGAGIYNTGTLVLTDTNITANNTVGLYGSPAGKGGGIYSTGTLTLLGATVSNNSAGHEAGGIEANGRTLIMNSTIDSNDGEDGGGIFGGGTLTLINSTVSNNQGAQICGGMDTNGTVIVSSSRVAGNRAPEQGGGICISGKLLISNSTIAGNSAGLGGGIVINSSSSGLESTVILIKSTVTNNAAYTSGGGIYNFQGTVTLSTSAVSSNTPDNCAPPNTVPGC